MNSSRCMSSSTVFTTSMKIGVTTSKGLERIVFEDGSVWDRFKIMSSIVNPGFDLDVAALTRSTVSSSTLCFDELHEADPDFLAPICGVTVLLAITTTSNGIVIRSSSLQAETT